MARFRSTLMVVTNLNTGRRFYYMEKCDKMQRVTKAEYDERYSMLHTPDGTLESIHSRSTRFFRRDYCTVVWSETLKAERGVRHIDAVALGIRSPHDMVSVRWEVDNASGSTECAAWQAQAEIERLERAGYKVLGVERVAT